MSKLIPLSMWAERVGVGRMRKIVKRCDARFRVLPLDQLRGLKRVVDREADCGVYFLWRGPRLMYIGKSKESWYRVYQHQMHGKKFTHATIEVLPEECYRLCERQYVLRYRPPYNRTRGG